LKGPISTTEKEELGKNLIEFATQEKRLNIKEFTSEDTKYISQRLKDFFRNLLENDED